MEDNIVKALEISKETRESISNLVTELVVNADERGYALVTGGKIMELVDSLDNIISDLVYKCKLNEDSSVMVFDGNECENCGLEDCSECSHEKENPETVEMDEDEFKSLVKSIVG